ncbi:branched-chain amino acid transport system II carrier protein [Bacillus benzoevorans]|uniref:Branched-chain amino acid transport system carrier protein n=1 Tax=Bacillus benzoevorans TaxID=1456 RepID=A0A7X0HQF4_9BACI|nr:branched-chain amino acid transport system II carrier protein [Bacillus benzoevorans]MBB6444978.1 LIVCS family branched-chain amino acid:cation transporter [Bacillus benzoevorans]
MNKQKISIGNLIAIGFMLFALFFGAGNLIFPPALGQAAGDNFWPAIIGFLLTGVGLPLLGVLAIGLSGHDHLQSMANRINPTFSLAFTVILYLSIGPFFAIPRTGTVSYEIAAAPFLPEMSGGFNIGLLIYSIVFFVIVGWLSLNPSKIVDRVGKVMTPILLICLLILLAITLIAPLDQPMKPIGAYLDNAFFKGFQEGYLTMDTLASLVFGIIVINAIKGMGVSNKKEIAISTIKSSLIASGCLGAIYLGLGYMGVTTNFAAGETNNGPAILTFAADTHFGIYGNIILGLAILFACLTTAIGLITSCASYFSSLFPRFSYKTLAIVFTVFSAAVANIGLNQLITISVPVLVVVYPIAIVLIFLTFAEPLFKGRVEVYRWSLLLTGIFSVIDGINAAGIPISGLTSFLGQYLPLFNAGMGWLVPALVGAVIGYIVSLTTRTSDAAPLEKIN